MTEYTPRARPRRRPRRKRRGLDRRCCSSPAVLVFALGVALGEALHDNPQPGPPQTNVRTLLPGEPATVTVTEPGSG